MAGTGSSEAAVGANMPSAEALTIVNPDICSPAGGDGFSLLTLFRPDQARGRGRCWRTSRRSRSCSAPRGC